MQEPDGRQAEPSRVGVNVHDVVLLYNDDVIVTLPNVRPELELTPCPFLGMQLPSGLWKSVERHGDAVCEHDAQSRAPN